jgi:hypothetical protein
LELKEEQERQSQSNTTSPEEIAIIEKPIILFEDLKLL